MKFKIRCSAIGQIMTNAKSKNETLSKTTISYLDNWIKEQLYHRKKEFTSKYTDKGLIMEDNSIDLISEHYGYDLLIKNEKQYENEFLKGTPDVIINSQKLVIDVKNSWDCFTFPLMENEIPTKGYYWQLQGYMALLGFDKASLIYTLTDTPVHLIEKEAAYYSKDNGLDINDVIEEFVEKMTYSHLPDKLRIKRFDIARNNEDIKKIEKRVQECNEYINNLNIIK